MIFGRLFRPAKDDGRRPVLRDASDLAERDRIDIGLIGPATRRSFEHAPVEVPNDRI
jgi:hypothetical protein